MNLTPNLVMLYDLFNEFISDDVLGVVSFIRHGEKQKQNNVPDNEVVLTKLGECQAQIYGLSLNSFYLANNISNLYLDMFYSGVKRTNRSIELLSFADSKFNKSIKKDEQLGFNVPGVDLEKIMSDYKTVLVQKGEQKANDWYLNTEHSKLVAKNFADFLAERQAKLDVLIFRGKKFHIFAGTHSPLPESFLKEILLVNGKNGFDSIYDIGGTLAFNEAVHVLYKPDDQHKIIYKNKLYNLDESKLKALQD